MIAFSEIAVRTQSDAKSVSGSGFATDLGYVVGGHRPGPTILVGGYSPVSDRIFDRLLALPSLPWLRGTLYLVRLEALGQSAAADAVSALSEVQIDRTLILPLRAVSPEMIDLTAEGYRRVLRLCAGLGMIQGRGIYPVR